MQRNWIGRSEGVEITFQLANSEDNLTVYTTRPDTFFGVSYVAVAAAHPLAEKAAENNPELAQFIQECKIPKWLKLSLPQWRKKGMATGVYAIHPLTGKSAGLGG